MNPINGFTPVLISSGIEHSDSLRQLQPEAPPRVRVAMSLLNDFTVKTSVHMAAESDSHDGFTSSKGQQLTVEEQQAQAAALALLTRYFAGTLEESSWDGVRANQAVKEEKSDTPQLWNEIHCPACGGVLARENCLMCGGARRVKVARVK